MDFESKDPSSNLGGTSFFFPNRRTAIACTCTFTTSHAACLTFSSEFTLAIVERPLLTVQDYLFQTTAFEGAHLAARGIAVLLKCLAIEKGEIGVSQRFAWTFLQLLNGPTVPEEDLTLGCASVIVAELVGCLTDFQRQFALLSFVKALLSSDNNRILFTGGTLQTLLFTSIFELIKELYAGLKDAQLVYLYFQGI